jgi:hypothetical protein
MGIFDKIKHAIWGDSETELTATTENPVDSTYLGTNSATTGVVPDVSTSVTDPAMRDVAAAGVQPVSKPAEIQRIQDPATTVSSVDIATNLDRAAANSGLKLDWRHSIVDLMKALGMDASLAERKELAAELNYSGDEHDSAKMNAYLHKTLMQKLAENGGKVPPELVD